MILVPPMAVEQWKWTLNLILSTIGLWKIHSLDVEEMKDRSQINCFAHKKMFCLMCVAGIFSLGGGQRVVCVWPISSGLFGLLTVWAVTYHFVPSCSSCAQDKCKDKSCPSCTPPCCHISLALRGEMRNFSEKMNNIPIVSTVLSTFQQIVLTLK